MRATRRHRWILVAACLLPGALAGCGGAVVPGGPGAGGIGFSEAELAAAAAGRPVGSPDRPTPPAPGHDANAAVQTLRYFWDAYNFAYRTGDPGPLAAVSGKDCAVCTEVLGDVASLAGGDLHVEGYRVTVQDVSVQDVEASAGSARATVTATISRQAGRAVGPTGDATDLPGFDHRTCTVTLARAGSGWAVSKVVTGGG